MVVGMAEESELPPERLAEPLRALEAQVPAALVRLGLWLAREYCSAPARGLALVLPPGTGTGSGSPLRPRSSLRVELTDAGRVHLRPRTRRGSARASRPRCGRWRPGRSARRPWAGTRAATTAPCAAWSAVAWWSSARPSSRAAGRGSTPWAPRPAPLRSPRRTRRAALDAVAARLEAGDPGTPLLLDGVTGSGKTEVYLRSVAMALERGRSAIVLVPEIALTPQTAGRFVERFGDSVAVMHSQLAPRERYDEWWRMRTGEARVCVGPRSAIFAPFADLGLIVIDEEHDASYKQEGDPRYDARRGGGAPRSGGGRRAAGRQRHPSPGEPRALPPAHAAQPRGPSPDAPGGARGHARGAGRAPRAHPERPGRGAPPRGEGDRAPEPPWLVQLPLLPQLRPRVGVPRLRRDAGAPSLRRRDRLPPLRPPRAGASGLPRLRVGVRGPPRRGHRAAGGGDRGADAPAARLPPGRGRHGGRRRGSVLRAFDAAPSGVLVGTQMVAKGHDFPAVTLAVVLDADSTLRFPDFRAEERTFALVAQLAGRSGRGERGGRVIVQALDPTARVLLHAAQHDSEGFLRGELGRREAFGYPPYGQLVRVVCSSEAPGPEMAAADAVRELIAAAGVPVLGPARALPPPRPPPGAARGASARARAGHRRGARGRGHGGRRPGARRGLVRGRRGSAVAADPGNGPPRR